MCRYSESLCFVLWIERKHITAFWGLTELGWKVNGSISFLISWVSRVWQRIMTVFIVQTGTDRDVRELKWSVINLTLYLPRIVTKYINKPTRCTFLMYLLYNLLYNKYMFRIVTSFIHWSFGVCSIYSSVQTVQTCLTAWSSGWDSVPVWCGLSSASDRQNSNITTVAHTATTKTLAVFINFIILNKLLILTITFCNNYSCV